MTGSGGAPRLSLAPPPRHAGRVPRRLLILACLGLLGGCAPLLETDQARLCRMALPAIEDADAKIRILRQTPFEDGRGLRIDYLAGAPDGRRRPISPSAALSRRAAPGDPRT